MIIYNDKNNWERQIKKDSEELIKYKNSYETKIRIYNMYLKDCTSYTISFLEERKIKEKLNFYKSQILKIDTSLNTLNDISFNKDVVQIERKVFNKYNQKYKEIKDIYIDNVITDEEIIVKYVESVNSRLTANSFIKNEYIEKEKKANSYMEFENKNENEIIEETNMELNEKLTVKNNDTLLISEKENKVLLPYTGEEVIELLNDEENNYQSVEDVINDRFKRPLSDFRFQFSSRYSETMKLAREREKFKLSDSIALAIEMMGKRYLHPAIIAACRTLNELDVYLDCLDKNELDDFKIFKIKYELYPMVLGRRKKKRKGSHFKKDTEEVVLKKFKTVLDMEESNA